tara:strand:+ start:1004 stop:2635 length:1632 start_codon:yes stop_codon:yes gene_type:complete
LISRYFHTIRYLKAKQIYHRIWFRLIRPNIDRTTAPNLRVLKNQFFLPIQQKQSLFNEDTFKFLNKSQSLSKIGWNENNHNVSKLWRYNLHYFDDLNAIGSSHRKIWHNELLQCWVNENKVGKGVGWEPYPTSLRIVNWIKWYFAGNKLSNICTQSLVFQARWLNKRIEWHILGNHLFANAKALVFAGLFFLSKESEIWLKRGLKIIENELKEQVLNDGGNFERSPMYHAIFIEDLLDLINISRTYPKIIQELHLNRWTQIIKNMLMWLDSMTHPDGGIAFFNDAALEIAPKLNQLKKYAQRLGINYSYTKFDKITHLADSGYVRISSNDLIGLLDVAPIGPDYMPGHAHADTLSFEISLFGQRLLINSGVSEYGSSSVRQYERSTKAHNTVVVNEENSSEVWNGFRVARRAYPFNLKIDELEDFVNITCAHDGYKRLIGKPIHRRNWKFFESSLIINDQIEGFFKNAFAYFHLHPQINVLKNQMGSWDLKLPNGRQVIFEVTTGKAQVEKSYYSPEFGKKIETKRLKVALDKKEGLCVKISW